MDYSKLGDAISEAIALKQLVETTKGKISGTQTTIDANNKEIARLEGLKDNVVKQTEAKAKLEAELNEQEKELKSRMEKLNKAGVKLPMDSGKGVVSL